MTNRRIKGMNMIMPSVEQYAGPNSTLVSIGDMDLYFSYKILVAFRKHGRLHVRANVWSSTIGKHLNAIDGGHRARLTEAEFTAKYQQECIK